MGFIALDLGASGTRYTCDGGEIRLIPNNMVILEAGERVDLEPQSSRIDSALEVTITKDEESKFFPVRALIGEMAARYSESNIRPTMLQSKHMQQINYVSALTAAALARLEFGLPEDLSMYIALPPIEAKTAKDEVKKQFTGRYHVTFSKYGEIGISTDINITDTECHEESFLAILSYFFGTDMQPRAAAKQYGTGTVLSIDIGASTTDFAIVKNSKYLDVSGQTYRIGGNVARDTVINEVKALHGFELPTADADIVMMEGRLPLGNSYTDASAILGKAKKRLAAQIIEKMQPYFTAVGIPIQTIKAIVVSGGGSVESQYVGDDGDMVITSKPMSYYVTDAIQQICPTVDIVPYGESPRFANIQGLYIRAMAAELKKKRVADAAHKEVASATMAPAAAPVVEVEAAPVVAEVNTPALEI